MSKNTDALVGAKLLQFLVPGHQILGLSADCRSKDLVIFTGYNPDGEDEGIPPLETLRRVLAEEWASVTQRERFWRNQSRQSGWVERPNDAPPLSEPAFERLLHRQRGMHGAGLPLDRLPWTVLPEREASRV